MGAVGRNGKSWEVSFFDAKVQSGIELVAFRHGSRQRGLALASVIKIVG